MKPIPRVGLLALMLVSGVSAAGGSATLAAASGKAALRVFAAASLTGPFSEIAKLYERRHAGVSVELEFAGSQQLVAQIEQGAAADVFASADERWMDHARDHGLLAGPAVPFVRNRLVVIVPGANPGRIRRLQDLSRNKIKFVTCGDAVPVGRYARTVLANLSREPGFGPDYAARVLSNVVSEEENVKAVASKVQLGEADAGIVYRSDVTQALARDVRVLEIPDAANVTAAYPIAALKSAPRPDDARAFVALVLSADGQRILARWAFTPVAAGGAKPRTR